MNRRNDIEVIIDNKRIVLSGYESEEYLHKVAQFINAKNSDMRKQEAYKALDSEMKTIFLQINIADEYFKIKAQLEDVEADNDSKCSEIYSLKHEIVSLQQKLEEARAELEEARRELIAEQKKVVKLETELSSERKARSGRKPASDQGK